MQLSAWALTHVRVNGLRHAFEMQWPQAEGVICEKLAEFR